MGMFDDLPEEPSTTQTAAPSAGLFDDLPDASSENEGVIDRTLRVGEELGRAVITAPISMVQGITELGTAGVDLALGSSTSRPTTEFFNYIKSYVAPETKMGKVGEELVAFGLGFIPIAGWLGRAGQAAKAAKTGARIIPATSRFFKSAEAFGASSLGKAALSTRAGLIGSTAVAAGAYESVMSPDGRATLSDAFDIFSPLKTEADTGLMGREEALRRLRNKARHGLFGAAASAVFDTALVGLGATAKAVGQTDAAAAAAKGVRTGFDALGRGAMAIPGVRPVVAGGRRFLSPLGGSTPEVSNEVFDTIARIDRTEALGIKGYMEYEQKLRKVIGGMKLPGKGKQAAREAESRLFHYLNGLGPRLTEYGEDVAKAADDLLETASAVRGSFIEAVERELKAAPAGSARADKLTKALDQIKMHQSSEQGFLRRMFKVHKDPIAYYRTLNLTGKDKELYDQAVEEVSWNLHKQDYLNPGSLALARYKVNEIIGLSSINNGVSPDVAIKATLNSLRSEAKTGPRSGIMSRLMPRLKLTPTLLTPREPLVAQSPKLRALMGEITDPKQLYLQTIGDMAKTTAALNFYRNITDDASRMVTPLADAVPALRAGQRPLFVRTPDTSQDLTGFDMAPFFQRAQELNIKTSLPDPTGQVPPGLGGQITPEKVIEDFTSELEAAGYTKLGSVENLDDVFVGQYGSLTGVYVAPEAYQAVTAPMRVGFDALQDFLGVLTQLRGFSQKMTIVFNPETQARNIIGNSLMLAGTANLGRSTDMYDVYRVFSSSLAELSDEGLGRLAKTIGLSGTTESNLVIKALQEFREEGKNLGATGLTRSAIDRFESVLPFRKFLESFYSNSDSFFKGVAVISEQNKLLRAFDDAGELIQGRDPLMRGIPDSRLLDELRFSGVVQRTKSASNPELSPLEVIAADAVKDMFPIYNRVGSFVQGLDKFPVFGNFMSFASENIRNSVNILNRGLKEMSFTVSPATREAVGEAAAQTFERSIRAQGAQRLLAFTSVAGILPQAAVRASAAMTDTSQEQMDAMYSQLPEFMKGQDIMVLSNDQQGRIEYYNLSSLFPYSFVVDPAKAALRAYNQTGELGKNEAQQILNGIWAGVSSYADPFASQAMSTEKLLDVMPRELLGRGGVTLTGSPVYLPSDTPWEKISSSLAHVTATFLPGYFREIVEVRSGDIRPGRITRAMMGIPGPQGEEYNLPAEFATFVTGLRPMELNLRRDFQFSGKEYAPRRQELKTGAMRYIRAPDRTPENMMEGWQSYLDGLYREQAKLYADIQAARKLGVSDQIIRQNLIKEANLGKDEVNAIMKGRFYPGRVTADLMKDIRRQERLDKINRVTPASEVPMREMNALSREASGRDLIPLPEEPAAAPAPSAPGGLFDDLPDEAPKGLFDDLPDQRQGAVMPPPTFGSTPALSAPQLPSAPANRASLSPALLGDNPASQMANMEIARRTSG